jgi:hypothetical protein
VFGFWLLADALDVVLSIYILKKWLNVAVAQWIWAVVAINLIAI